MSPTPRVAIIHGPLRAEERLLFAEFNRRGIAFDRIDDRTTVFDLDSGRLDYDIAIGRSVSQQRTFHTLTILDAWGIPTINQPSVIEICNDKLRSSAAFSAAWLSASALFASLRAWARAPAHASRWDSSPLSR